MIVTAQPFLNEVDLLLTKFSELEGEVDAHIVVESPITFTGVPKPLFFEENKERFSRFNVIHSIVDIPKDADTPWHRELVQYNYLRQIVRDLKPEIGMWLDADELPRAGVVERFRDSGEQAMTLEMDILLFDFSRKRKYVRWHNSKIAFYEEPQPWRESLLPVLENAGWHCDYFGSDEHLLLKLNATSHAFESITSEFKRQVKLGNRPTFWETEDYPLERWPIAARERWEQTRQCA